MDLNKTNNSSPLDYNQWVSINSNISPDDYEKEYILYLKDWYFKKSISKSEFSKKLRDDYVKLLKDLSYLFTSDEIDLFISQLDYNNDEEIIFAIPFFAKKLKQIALIYSRKREALKQAKLKYNLIGSNYGIEKILYDYILKGFTKSETNLIRVPSYEIYNNFPELSSIKNDFFIEVEELHDKNTYFDSDPSVNISNYVDANQFNSDFLPDEFLNLKYEEIINLMSSKFLPKASTSILSKVFNEFLSDIPNINNINEYNIKALNFLNTVEASKKYLGEAVYGLTAIKLKDVDVYDDFLNLNFNTGNNWFYWPSGDRVLNDSIFNNTYLELSINDSDLISSGATGGDSYTNSDLIFTDKSGIVEGAWLRGIYNTKPQRTEMICNIKSSENKEFIFPYTGILFSPKSLIFSDYRLNDSQNFLLDSLSPQIRENILSDYFTGILSTSSCNPIYLNNTTLISNGSYADTFSDTADNIIKKKKNSSKLSIYDEETNTPYEQAYLYKFDKTDIPIRVGLNNIYWPLQNYTEDPDIKLTITKEHSLPVSISEINVTNTMAGAVAGLDFQTADVLYKLNTKDSDPIEAAWLGSSSITRLDTEVNSIKIYDTPAVKCAQYIDGPIQPSLSIKINPSEKKSFIWMDEDTYADDVFKYIPHLPTCPYNKQFPHDYYSDQDFQNENPINDVKHWKKCNCKSVQYSPIGHSGNVVTDFNGMADYLFADPDGLGEDFALNSWSDTRNLTVKNSPQFAFYKIKNDYSSDLNVGWGSGFWKTGNGSKMVLKCGRRYTYYRTSLRSNRNDSPYFIGKYNYKKINGLLDYNDGYDLIIVIDRSKSQSLTLETTKKCVINIIDKLLEKNKNIQIGLITFGLESNVVSFLSKNKEQLKLKVSSIFVPTELYSYETKIINSIKLAELLLTQKVVTSETQSGITDLCKNLNFKILDDAIGNTYENFPQENKPKKILFFGDGEETDMFREISSPTSNFSIYDNTISELEKNIKIINNNLEIELEEFSNLILDSKKELEDNNLLLNNYNSSLDKYKSDLNYYKSAYDQTVIDINANNQAINTNYKNISDSIKSELSSEVLNLTNKYNSINALPKKQKQKRQGEINTLKSEIDNLNSKITQINSYTASNLNDVLSIKRDFYNSKKNELQNNLNYYNGLKPKERKKFTTNIQNLQNAINSYSTIINSSYSNSDNSLIFQNLISNLTTLQNAINNINNNINDITLKTEEIKQKNIPSLTSSYELNKNASQLEINNINDKLYIEQQKLLIAKQEETKLLIDNFYLDVSTKIVQYIVTYCQFLKEKKINIYTVDVGLKSYNNDIIEKMSGTYSNYFNLQKYLDYGDGDLNSFISYISMRINGSLPVIPIWYKAKRNSFGNWESSYDDFGNLEISDMILNPGDYLGYIHRSNVAYFSDENQTDFSVSSLSFTINIKLNGWDYQNNIFSINNYGYIYGAKPFWAKVNTIPNEVENFNKETIAFGGKIKFIDDYLPIQQPIVSDIYLDNGCILEYVRKKQSDLLWKQPLLVFNTESKYVWNKLLFKKDISNLADIMNKQKLDGIVIETNEPSDIILEGYRAYKPAKYNYYARNPFAYEQGLYNKNRCINSFFTYNTGVIIEPANPYENILNTHFPTIANIPNPYNIVSNKDVGDYLLPENLGLSFYRGKGYNISIDNDSLEYMDSLDKEKIYFNLEKYGPRNRGLSKNDQITISKIDSIDNTWIMQPYGNADASGMIVNTKENQKMIPYQTNYEIESKNRYGLSRQDDNFKFWDPKNPTIWTDEKTFPLTFRKELTKDVYLDRKNKLLTQKGKLQNWRLDIFGNEYGIYKKFLPNDISKLELWFSSDFGVINDTTNNIVAMDNQIVNKWMNKSTSTNNDLIIYSGQPKYKHLGINNFPSITFNLSSTLDVMKNNYQINLSELTFIVVGKVYNDQTNSQTLSSIIGFGDSVSSLTDYITGNKVSLGLSLSSNIFNFSFGNISKNNQINLDSSSFSLNVTSSHLFEFEFSGTNCFSYIDSVLIDKSNTFNETLTSNIYSNKGLWVGSYVNGFFKTKCEISEILLYSKKLNSLEKERLYFYINNKYNLF
jgi:hypothetical protein